MTTGGGWVSLPLQGVAHPGMETGGDTLELGMRAKWSMSFYLS